MDVDAMLAQMSPEMLNERMAYELVIRDHEEEPSGVAGDDPNMMQKFLGN